MIGGMMLLCAVGAMVMIAAWSLQRDDLSGPAAATGLLALRAVPQRSVARKHGAPERNREQPKRRDQPAVAKARRSAKPDLAPPQKAKAQSFNTREMMDVAREIEERAEAPTPELNRVGF